MPYLAVFLVLVSAQARAQEVMISAPDEAISPREAVLGLAIGAMALCALVSSLLSGRASARTHVALATLIVLIAAVSLFVLFGSLLYQSASAAVAIFAALVALFKLLNRFEAGQRSERGRHGR